MSRFGLTILVTVNVALALLLAWLWVTPQGQLRNLRWQAPNSVKPQIGDAPTMPVLGGDIVRYGATLDRPLFAPTRRPPPKPEVAPADNLADVTVLGVYGAEATGGMIARINGQVRRSRVGETVSGWTLKQIGSASAVFSRGEETRTLEVKLSLLDSASAAVASGSAGAPTSAAAVRQADIESARERVRQMNRTRARLGMTPLPEP